MCSMENIMIINDKTSFREGLKKLLELKYGRFFDIIGTDSKQFRYENKDVPRLIIIERISNSKIERFLIEMRKKGAKVVLLGLKPDNIQSYIELDLFDGFLLKNMPTNQLLTVLEEILEHDDVYVHPDIGYFFLKKLQKKNN